MRRSHGQDIISQLPDAILHCILFMMPMKYAIRTSTLSKRLKDLWKFVWAYNGVLDFGEEFTAVQTPLEATVTINRILELHESKNIDLFRLFIYPADYYLYDIQRWVKFSVERRVKELDLGFPHWYFPFLRMPGKARYTKPFKLPPCLFMCDSLTHMKLASCNFNLPSGFNGFSSLKALSLNDVEITCDMLQTMLLSCPALEILTLFECFCGSLKASAPDLKLTKLTVAYCFGVEIELFAPNLLSFHFNDEFFSYSLKNLSSLEDAIITTVDLNYAFYSYNRTMILSKIAHVKILTICDVILQVSFHPCSFQTPSIAENLVVDMMLMCSYVSYHVFEVVSEGEIGDLPIVFPNPIELQLIMRVLDNSNLAALYVLFRNCPLPHLEKLFIELQTNPNNAPTEHLEEPIQEPAAADCVFYHLKTVKFNSFCGCENQMWLVKFLLEKAIVLESLVLVEPKNGIKDSAGKDLATDAESNETQLRLLGEQLKLLPKASAYMQIKLCKYLDNDNSLRPTHIEVHNWINL